MSDHWENYPCTMGNHASFVTYDHGVRDELAKLPFPNFVSFRVTLLRPDDRGLPTGNEFNQLNDVEDFLCSQLKDEYGLQVGRITSNGSRYFHFYSNLDEDEINLLAEQAAQLHNHPIALLCEADPERTHYWNELFPTSDDWQVIQDIHVQESLERNGDTLDIPRPIEHWAYFPSAVQRQSFIEDVKAEFDEIHLSESETSAKGRFVAKLVKTGLPDYRSMNHSTLLLNRAARTHGGDYDGWETLVCKS